MAGDERSEQERWESYFYPETYDPVLGVGVLRNIPGYRDPDVLRQFEYEQTTLRAGELRRDPGLVEKSFGVDHLRAIHGYLFQDVYAWAGQLRDVPIAKYSPDLAPDDQPLFAPSEDFELLLGSVQEFVVETDWKQLGKADFAECAATVFAYTNYGHPFREGNGRTIKTFLNDVASQSEWRLDFSRVEPGRWNMLSSMSRPTMNHPVVDTTVLYPMFSELTVEASKAPQRGFERLGKVRAASYPRSAAEIASGVGVDGVRSYREIKYQPGVRKGYGR